MVRHGYPESETHRARHARLMDQLADLRRQLLDRGRIDSQATLLFLQDWLVTHICTEDRRYSKFLNSKGVF